MIARKTMRYLVTAGEHVSNIQAITRQPPIRTIKELLRAVFSVRSVRNLYNEGPRPAQWLEQAVTLTDFDFGLSKIRSQVPRD
jgi:hypothetical protein